MGKLRNNYVSRISEVSKWCPKNAQNKSEAHTITIAVKVHKYISSVDFRELVKL